MPVLTMKVQNNLRHTAVGTTSMYLTTERDTRLKAMRGSWKKVRCKSGFLSLNRLITQKSNTKQGSIQFKNSQVNGFL